MRFLEIKRVSLIKILTLDEKIKILTLDGKHKCKRNNNKKIS